MIVIDAFAVGCLILAIYHPSLLLILCALFGVFMAIGFAGVAIEGRRLDREKAHTAKLLRIIKEDNARP